VDLRFFRNSTQWEVAIAVAAASVACGGLIASVAPLSPAVSAGAPSCAQMSLLTQFVVRNCELALPIGVVLGVAFLSAAWIAYRSARDETEVLRRALHLSLFGFSLLLVSLVGAFLGLFVLPAASCAV
jgi:hypothetical protein